nr:glycosyltransferase family 4 protein [Saprospiraceae bacterium]
MKAEPGILSVMHLSTASEWRGGEQQLYYLFRQLEKKGIDQWLVMPGGQADQKMRDLGLKPKKLFFRQPWLLWDAFRIARFCDRNNIDILHAHDSKAHSLAVLSVTLFNCRSSIIAHRRVDNPIRQNLFTRWKYNHPSVRAVICISKKVLEITADFLKHPQKATLVYSAVDPPTEEMNHQGELKKILGIPDTDKVIGNISAIDHHKDPFTFIKTAAALLKERRDLSFVWIGTGNSDLIRDLKVLVDELGMQGKIHFPGYIDQAKKHLWDFDVFLFTSATEGLGTTVLDALIRKVPVVATAAGGVPELILHRETGYLAEVGDATGLKEGITTVLNDGALRAEMLRNGYRRAGEHFSP